MMLISHGAVIKTGKIASLTGGIILRDSFCAEASVFVTHKVRLFGVSLTSLFRTLIFASAFCYK